MADAALSITKTASKTSGAVVGDEITYTVVVTNSGNVKVTDITLSDTLISLTEGEYAVEAFALEAGGSKTITYKYTVTQAKFEAGKVENTVTASGKAVRGEDPEDVSAKATVTMGDTSAELSITKTASKTSGAAAGDEITYTVVVTNSGDIEVTDITLSDTLVSLTEGDNAVEAFALEAGGSKTITYKYTVTQDDFDAGKVENTVTASGKAARGEDPEDVSADATVTMGETSAKISITKTASPTSDVKVGDTITYTVIVKNEGDVSVKTGTLEDDHADLSAKTFELAPGASETFTYTYTVLQADIDAGKIVNVVSANAKAERGEDPAEVTATAEVTTVAAEAELTVEKSAAPESGVKVGDKVTYTVVVTNSGNVTVTDIVLSDTLVTLTDAQKAIGTLAPAGTKTITYEYTVTQADVDAGKIDNTATATGKDPSGEDVTASDDATVTTEAAAAELSITKEASKTSGAVVGDEITYTVVVTNSGNVKVTDITLSDTLVSLTEGEYAVDAFALEAGGSKTITYKYTVTQAKFEAGKVENTVTASGKAVRGEDPEDVSAKATVTMGDTSAELSITKTASKTSGAAAGDEITYTVVVTNSGDIEVTDITLSDTLVSLTEGDNAVEAFALEAGGSKTITYKYTVTQDDFDAGKVENTVTASGKAARGEDPEDVSADATVTMGETSAKISITKTASPTSDVKVGDTITYTVIVKNEGDVSVKTGTLEDDHADLSAKTFELAPGASETFTYTYTVLQADIDAGKIVNVVSANAKAERGEDPAEVTATAEVTTVAAEAELTVEKSAAPESGVKVGDKVTYTVVVKNTGNVSVKDGTLADDHADLSGKTFALAPDEEATFTYEYTVTQADVDASKIVNVVKANATAVRGENPEEATATATVTTEDPNGHLTVTKVTTSEPANGKTYALGETITYKITVKNDGNLTITDITVTDELTEGEWKIESLAPGASEEFKTSYTVTEADILKGEVLNVATAKGTSPDPEEPEVPVEPGKDPEPTDDPNGHLTVTKETTSEKPEGGYALGDTVSYKITVTNDGNLTITDITVTDERTGGEWTIKSLTPGASEVFETKTTVTEKDILSGHILNEATAKGTSPDEDKPDVPVTPGTTDDEPEDPDGHITIEKVTTSKPENGETYALGETITYKITVKNDGNLTITDITVTDELTEGEWKIESLAPGASEEFKTSYTVTEADILKGEVLNVATAKGTSPDPEEPEVPVEPGKDPEPTDKPDGHITIKKETTSEPENGKTYALGETITYKITVTNDGNLTITDITVTDELTEDEWKIESLAPGKSEEFDAKYVVTEEDVLKGTVLNVATGKGTSPDPDHPEPPVIPGEDPEPTDSPNGHITIEKVTTSEPANGKDYAYGETITYKITVKNDGNVTITDIEVEDELTGDKWTIESLKPDETKEFDAKYVVTEEDVLAGSVRNEATGKGKSPDPENPDVPVTPGIETVETEDPVELTITADDITIDYGDEEPELTVTAEGFVNGEDISMIEFEISREPGDQPGEYKITVTGDTQQGHYTITFVDGTFTILPGEYEFTKGMGQHWQKGSSATADFEVTRSVHDERAFGYYQDIEIDGKLVDKSQYKYEEGCVELYISAEYMQGLAVGRHTIRATFEDGEATTDFYVDAEPKDYVPTGDNNNLPLWVSLMGVSAAGAAAAVLLGKKKRKEDEDSAK